MRGRSGAILPPGEPSIIEAVVNCAQIDLPGDQWPIRHLWRGRPHTDSARLGICGQYATSSVVYCAAIESGGDPCAVDHRAAAVPPPCRCCAAAAAPMPDQRGPLSRIYPGQSDIDSPKGLLSGFFRGFHVGRWSNDQVNRGRLCAYESREARSMGRGSGDCRSRSMLPCQKPPNLHLRIRVLGDLYVMATKITRSFGVRGHERNILAVMRDISPKLARAPRRMGDY
jgi:hypothetical protein